MSFETQNIEYRGGSYSYYSPSNSEDYTLINLEVFTTLGLGWAGFKFFARPGVVINVDERDNSNYDFYVSKNTVAGMFETGFRFARNHEFLIAWQSGIISDIGIYVTTERSLFIGYRYVPTVGRKAF